MRVIASRSYVASSLRVPVPAGVEVSEPKLLLLREARGKYKYAEGSLEGGNELRRARFVDRSVYHHHVAVSEFCCAVQHRAVDERIRPRRVAASLPNA